MHERGGWNSAACFSGSVASLFCGVHVQGLWLAYFCDTKVLKHSLSEFQRNLLSLVTTLKHKTFSQADFRPWNRVKLKETCNQFKIRPFNFEKEIIAQYRKMFGKIPTNRTGTNPCSIRNGRNVILKKIITILSFILFSCFKMLKFSENILHGTL